MGGRRREERKFVFRYGAFKGKIAHLQNWFVLIFRKEGMRGEEERHQ